MSKLSENRIFFANSTFSFSGASCDCEVDTVHPSKGVQKHIFRLYPSDQMLHYAYKSGQGLVSSKSKDMARGREVLPELLTIKDGDVEGVKTFFMKHGFLLSLDPSEGNSVDAEPLFEFINRLKATVSLMSTIVETNTDYTKMLALTMYLLLSPQTSIELPNWENPFSSYESEMSCYWHNTGKVQERTALDITEFQEGIFVNDSIRAPGKRRVIDSELREGAGYEPYDFSKNKDKIEYLFINAANVGSDCRLAIDFLYHFFEDIGEIKGWSHTGELALPEDITAEVIKSKLESDEQLRSGLLRLAKQTLKTEIEFNLGGIIPSYDIETMSPTWRIVDLISGLYLSVFYIQPNIALYRYCARPNCGKPFLVRTTATKKMYCSKKCTNAMQQYKSRLKNKQKKT